MLKRRIQDLTVCFTYNFSCLQPQNRSQKDFRTQYQLREEIQRGGFGIVYKAYRVSDGLPVAVKYVEHKHVREWTMFENQLIPTEVCHLELCSGIPGVVNLIDWFASSRGFMIVMERPEKCMDLFDVITVYGRLDEDVARWIFVQVVDAVLEMRTVHSLVHRDIKDENIIVDMETGVVKLVDFGAADFIDSAQKKHFQGTRSYCPPEWFKQKIYLPVESTTWSLGILLYTMIVGRVPFRNEIQTCMGRLHFPADVSQDCQHLIQRCLCITPKRRLALNEIRSHKWTQNDPSLKYAGAFSTLLRKRSLKCASGRRRANRRRQNSVAWSSFGSENESEDEPALRRSFALATPSPQPQQLTPNGSILGMQQQQQVNGQLTPNHLNVSIYDFLPTPSPSTNNLTPTPVMEQPKQRPMSQLIESQTKRFSQQCQVMDKKEEEEKKRRTVSNVYDEDKERTSQFLDDYFNLNPHPSTTQPPEQASPIQRSSSHNKSMKRNPLLRQLAEHRQSYVTAEQQDHSTTPTQEKSFDMFQSVTSNFSRYDSAREKTTDLSDDAMSLGQASSSLMYYSACESLPSEDEDHTHADNLVTLPFHRPSVSNPPFYYDDSLRSLAMFEDENDAYILTDDLNGAIDRTRTPSADTNTEICKTPSPQPSVRNQRNVVEDKPTTSTQIIQVQPQIEDKKAHKSVASSLNKRIVSGVRRAKSLKLTFRDKSSGASVAPKKYSAVMGQNQTVVVESPSTPQSSNRQSLPLKVVQHLAANSYDTLVALSAKMADKSGGQELNAGNLNGQRKAPQLDPSSLYKDSRMAKISKNLGDIVAERRQRLLQNANGGEVVQGEKFKQKRSKSRDSASSTTKSLQYETVRFPLAVFDVCQQQLPLLEQVSK